MENQVTPEAEQKAPELGIADLQNLRTLIDVAVRRGTFNASELSSVGAVFDRVNAFLNAVAPKKDEAADTEANTPASE